MGRVGTASVGGTDLAVVFDGVTKRYGFRPGACWRELWHRAG